MARSLADLVEKLAVVSSAFCLPRLRTHRLPVLMERERCRPGISPAGAEFTTYYYYTILHMHPAGSEN